VSVCLDAFALIAWLQDEPGAEQVGNLLQQASAQEDSRCFISLLNLGEVYYQLARKRGADRADDFWNEALRGDIPVTLVDVTRKRVLAASRLKARYPLALADAFAIQLAQEMRLPLVTGDPEIEAPEKLERSLQVIWLPKRTT
jgi:predicted nucleic acid-binding protein